MKIQYYSKYNKIKNLNRNKLQYIVVLFIAIIIYGIIVKYFPQVPLKIILAIAIIDFMGCMILLAKYIGSNNE